MLKKNETEEQCAIRETFEETGLKVKVLNNYRYTQTYFVKQDVLKEVVYFLARRESGVLRKQEEINSLGFYSFDEALKLISYKDTISLFEEALKDTTLIRKKEEYE